MGRRKNYMDDGQDSSDDEESGRINFDITEDDLDAEVAGFSGQRNRRRQARFGDSDDDDQEDEMDIRGGLGHGGLGLAPSFLPAKQPSETPEDSPVKKDAVKEKTARTRATPSTPLPGPGFAQFNKHSKGFGQKMLEKMGWSVGKGLGADGEGIVNPVETKLRPARMGLSFRGFDERTTQAKLEAKARRGEVSSEDEEEQEQELKGKRRNAWKSESSPSSSREQSQRKRKPKTIYKTAAEILAETEQQQIPLSQQKVIDMTGPSSREINLADIKRTDSPTLMEVTTRLPELQHNLRLMVDLSRADLENLSREKQTNTFRMKSLQEELGSIKAKLDTDQKQLQKLEQLKMIASQLEQISKNALATGAFNAGNITALFGEQFQILERDYINDIKAMNIDALVISVWAPIMKYKAISWNVLEEPTWGVADVKKWKQLLTKNDDSNTERGWTRNRAQQKDLVCTPFETMMNTIWLSKVRSAIK